jgi:hypothetical protein
MMHRFAFVAVAALLPVYAFAADAAPSFIPLTSIPGIQEAVASDSLAILLNNLYKLCIGLAAVIAVLKIIQGGVTYMLGDSVTEKKEAKHHIAMAVLGLVFILSPYLVFSVIDPRILKLDVDVSGLKPPAVTPQAAAPGPSNLPAVQLEQTCTNPSYQTQIEQSLASWRRTHPTGENNMDITGLGHAGMGCCAAVTDTDGSKCVARSGSGFVNGSETRHDTYSCVCTSRGVASADALWKVNEVSVRFDFRNVDAPSDIKNSTPHTMRVVNTAQTFPTKEACESTTGFGQAQLYPSITGGAYACPQTGGGYCPQRVSWLRNQTLASLPPDTLTLQSRSCLQQ